MKKAIVLFAALLAGCTSAPAPQPPALPAPAPAAAAAEPATTVYVSGSTVNVRREGSTSADVLAQVKRGERLTLVSSSGEWMEVRLPNGTRGYVASWLVSTTPPGAAATRTRRGNCPPDSDFRFLTTPMPAFSQDGPHGLVVVEATVDARGIVTATRIVSNDTGEPALGTLTEREIRNAKFAPPVRDCAPKAFIYTYKRTF